MEVLKGRSIKFNFMGKVINGKVCSITHRGVVASYHGKKFLLKPYDIISEGFFIDVNSKKNNEVT